jgi:hypothetical protein
MARNRNRSWPTMSLSSGSGSGSTTLFWMQKEPAARFRHYLDCEQSIYWEPSRQP